MYVCGFHVNILASKKGTGGCTEYRYVRTSAITVDIHPISDAQRGQESGDMSSKAKRAPSRV